MRDGKWWLIVTCPEGALPLLALAEDTARERLLASPLGGLLPGEKIADLFCGGGGWDAAAKALGLHVDFAVNHDPIAIATHELNYPSCRRHRGDAWRTKPREVVGDAKIGILFASAACTTHSRARGSAPISKRVHMLGWCIARWMEDVQPRIVLIENVPEWVDWGPTIERADANGVMVRSQDPARKGQHFRRWWRYCVRLGYKMEMRVLDAPDYGEASRRRRLFIIARRDSQPICWPEKTHGQVESHVEDRENRDRRRRTRNHGRSADAGSLGRIVGIAPHRTAADIIDWSNLGTSIFERPRPLKPKTLGRIVEGVRRFVLNDARPFILRVTQTGGGWAVAPIDMPMPTQTTRQDLAIGIPIVAPQNTDVYGQRVDATGPTVTTKGHQSLVTPILSTTGYGERLGQAARVSRVADLLGTCVNGVKQAVVSPLMMVNTTNSVGSRVDAPTGTLTTGGSLGLYAPVMAYLNHGGKQVGRVDEPGRTVLSGGNHAMLVAALFMEYYGNNATCRKGNAFLGAVTTLDRHGLVSCVIDGVTWTVVDILFRMLQPHELAAAMGFPSDYHWAKTKRDTVRLIGNAVSVRTARALIGSVVPRGIHSPEQERGAA